MHNFTYKFYQERLRSLDYVAIKNRIGNRKVYVWGADFKGIELAGYFRECGIQVEGFLDGRIEKIEGEYVCKPDEIIVQGNSKDFYIVVSMFLKHQNEVCSMLKRNGFSKGDFYYPYRDWSFAFSDIVKRVDYSENNYWNKGKKLAEALDDKKLYFLLYGAHIGDEILALSYLEAFKREHYIREITVITSDLFSGLAKLYKEDINELLVWEKEDLEALRIYSLSTQRVHLNVLGANWVWFPQDRKIPFPINLTVYKTMHLGLPYETKSKYFSCEYDGATRNKFEKLGVIQGKSVILIPYAKSVSNMPHEYWEELAERLLKKYKVFTNVGRGEEPIKGTRPLSIPLNELPFAADYAGHTIAIRCGAADILALGKCRGCQVIYWAEDEVEENYIRTCCKYVNGEESILYENGLFFCEKEDKEKVIKRIIEGL